MPELIVALDQVALLRESRHSAEPDPAAAGVLAELAGADALSLGLRTDRRHVQERDVKVLRAVCRGRLQVRVPPTPESIRIVAPIRPDSVASIVETTPGSITPNTGRSTRSLSACSAAAEAVLQATTIALTPWVSIIQSLICSANPRTSEIDRGP